MTEKKDERVELSQEDMGLLVHDFIVAVAHLKAMREVLNTDERFKDTPQSAFLTTLINGAMDHMDFAKRIEMEVILLRKDSGPSEMKINGRIQ